MGIWLLAPKAPDPDSGDPKVQMKATGFPLHSQCFFCTAVYSESFLCIGSPRGKAFEKLLPKTNNAVRALDYHPFAVLRTVGVGFGTRRVYLVVALPGC